jgi:uncharacterized protein YjgD (DUF1641 family)
VKKREVTRETRMKLSEAALLRARRPKGGNGVDALVGAIKLLSTLSDDEVQRVMRALMAYFKVPAGRSRFK